MGALSAACGSTPNPDEQSTIDLRITVIGGETEAGIVDSFQLNEPITESDLSVEQGWEEGVPYRQRADTLQENALKHRAQGEHVQAARAFQNVHGALIRAEEEGETFAPGEVAYLLGQASFETGVSTLDYLFESAQEVDTILKEDPNSLSREVAVLLFSQYETLMGKTITAFTVAEGELEEAYKVSLQAGEHERSLSALSVRIDAARQLALLYSVQKNPEKVAEYQSKILELERLLEIH